MFGHKSFLRIGPLNDSSITGLYKESYELESCSYGFSQSVDNNGKAQTDVQGGTIYVTYSNLPPKDMLKWALSTSKYEDGAIIICDDNDMPLEKILFDKAACVGMEINYSQKGRAYMSTKLTLQAKKISVGEVQIDNYWIGFDN